MAVFTGISATEITVPDMSVYRQLSIAITTRGNSNGEDYRTAIGTAIIPRSTFIMGMMTLKAYGGDSSTWGSIQSTGSNTTLVCNRTSATTYEMRIWGIR